MKILRIYIHSLLLTTIYIGVTLLFINTQQKKKPRNMGIDSRTTSFRVKEAKKVSFCYGDDRPLLSVLHKASMDGLNTIYQEKEVDDVIELGNKGTEEKEKRVCVTSAASYLGAAIVKQLLAMGYSVCALLDKPDEEERLREMGIIRGEEGGKVVEMRWVSLTENDGIGERSCLYDAFSGCSAVFHTSSLIDPFAISGYSKSMAELEVKAAINVIKTCSMTPSITKCVLTSSLASCIWQDDDDDNTTRLIDHNSWSQDTTCINKKLWFALGKVRAEREAWRIAQETHLKLATLCPALVTGHDYYHKNPTPTIAYLKGFQEMYEKGVLATIDVTNLAKAHVNVYEAMHENAGRRSICFDRVVSTEDEARRLAMENGMIFHGDRVRTRMQYQLSNGKMNKILLPRRNRCYTYIH
ncbi:hypothetical protein V2J09_011645 [Rumex salicifolius]